MGLSASPPVSSFRSSATTTTSTRPCGRPLRRRPEPLWWTRTMRTWPTRPSCGGVTTTATLTTSPTSSWTPRPTSTRRAHLGADAQGAYHWRRPGRRGGGGCCDSRHACDLRSLHGAALERYQGLQPRALSRSSGRPAYCAAGCGDDWWLSRRRR